MVYIDIGGGYGNQLFMYAFGRAIQEMNKDEGVALCTSGLTGEGIRKLGLSPLPLNESVCILNGSIKKYMNPAQKILNKAYAGLNILFKKNRVRFKKIEAIIQPLYNFFGLYYVMNGYIEPRPTKSKNKFTVGYFHSERYFKDYPEIIEELRFSGSVKSDVELLKKIESCHSVCVHIRCGDYFNHSGFYVCKPDYYVRAVRFLSETLEDPVFFVFSDDISWAKENVALPENTFYADGNSHPCESNYIMSQCKHFIISNSSFSWWAQYMCQNPDKIVVAPDRWLNSDTPIDLYDPAWVLLETELFAKDTFCVLPEGFSVN